MNKLVIFIILMVSIISNAQVTSKQLRTEPLKQNSTNVSNISIANSEQDVFLQATKFYKNEAYESSIAVLQKLKVTDKVKPELYFMLGLNFYHINNYELSENYLLEVTKNYSFKDVSKAYYYLGLSQLKQNKFEAAINSLELATDTSTDLAQDTEADKLIASAYNRLNLVDESKYKYTLGLTAGYLYDTNALNISSSQSNVNGHVLSLSGYLLQKLWSDGESSIEPSLYFADQHTFDNQSKLTNEIQEADSTQLIASIPYSTSFLDYKSVTSVNIGFYLLPSEDQNRNLSITLIYLKQNLGLNLSPNLEFDGQLIIGRDSSQLTFINAADNQTAIKYDISGALKYNITTDSDVDAQLGVISNNAEGSNANYLKLYTNLGYSFPSLKTTMSNLMINYGLTNYADSELGRKDSNSNISYSVLKEVTDRSSLQAVLSSSHNKSTISDYSYDDLSLGFKYIFLTKF